ncbi:cohesin domain-containing protein [bacterium]|nr:cohesin domain-containing protein [bacterium]MDC0349858.1 cohesin domain-containing protein [bacterium]
MTIQAAQRQVVAGGRVWVPVYLLRSDNVANINFEITYDASVAVPDGDLVAGNLLGGRLFSANPGDPGIVRVGFSGTDGVFGTGTVAWIPFRAVGQPGQRTVLSVTVSTINEPNGAEPPIDRINGAIIIVDANGLTPGDCDGNGYLTEFDAFCALQMSVQLRPVQLTLDIDNDGAVTSRDATIILQRVTGRA